MNLSRTLAGFMLAAALPCAVHADDADMPARRHFEGEVYTEVNYGYKSCGEARNSWDFPHLVLSGKSDMGRGWSVEAEFEYERLKEDGEWCNDHWDNFTTNRLYLSKRWSEALGMKVGIIDVPLGITNRGGAALTIYDPVNEAGLLPMTWHETGAALYGDAGRWTYTFSLLAYCSLPLGGSRMIGSAATLHFRPVEGLNVGAGGFWGKSDKGMVCRCSPDFIGDGTTAYGVVDAEYDAYGWTIDGSFVYCSEYDARSVGIEAGYDVLSASGCGCSLIPFVRYDGIYHTPGADMEKYSVGLSLSPVSNLKIAAEYGMVCTDGCDREHRLDIGVGYTLSF